MLEEPFIESVLPETTIVEDGEDFLHISEISNEVELVFLL